MSFPIHLHSPNHRNLNHSFVAESGNAGRFESNVQLREPSSDRRLINDLAEEVLRRPTETSD